MKRADSSAADAARRERDAQAQRVREASIDESFSGTEADWFSKDLAELEAANPDWNRDGRIAQAQRWLEREKPVHLAVRIFGEEIVREAQARKQFERI
ncbi:hypothetical protein [Caballeronia mineralivorans]|uniref:hypothetical protein n=1 Tax=Caballeronia mineralivorans TaxID=2010198 RepID=UPI0023F19752|nr:hypothetical protein [Caballeronia mineralivorans]